MEIIIKVALIHSLKDIEKFSVRVNINNYKIIKKRLELEQQKAINVLKVLKEQGKIRSISIPIDIELIKKRKIDGKEFSFRQKKRPTELQNEIDNIVKIKKEIKQSINSISEVFCK